jgi:hypothetical protein
VVEEHSLLGGSHGDHLKMPFGTCYRVAVVQTDISENVSSPSSGGHYVDRFTQLHYRRNTVTDSPYRGIILMAETSVRTKV